MAGLTRIDGVMRAASGGVPRAAVRLPLTRMAMAQKRSAPGYFHAPARGVGRYYGLHRPGPHRYGWLVVARARPASKARCP